MSRFERNLSESGEILCNKCNVILSTVNCEKGRYTCKICRKKDSIAKNELNKLKENTISEKICKECDQTLAIDLFEKTSASSYRNVCKKCRWDKRKNTETVPKEIILENAKDKTKKCIECNQTKVIIGNFGIHTNNYRNKCQECYNKCGYYKTYRARKRLEDNPSFIAHNTKIHKEWVAKNLEQHQQYMKTYTKSLNGIIAKYKSSELYQNLRDEFGNIDNYEDFMVDIISQECFYCGFKDDTYYNGIDKIDSSGGYVKENIKPCCQICNYMKNTVDIGSFLRKVREIAIYNQDIVELPIEFTIPLEYHHGIPLVGNSSNYNRYKYRAIISKNIEFNITHKNFIQLTSSICYLCGESQEYGIGIDRKDNNIGYTLENSFPCCSYCNYMKRDQDHLIFLNCIKNITTYSISEEHDTLSKSSKLNRACNLT
jgi:hypothetical protein